MRTYNKSNKIRTDYYLNVANDYTIEKFVNLNSDSITLSVELDIDMLNKIKNKEKSEIIIYGTPECMIIKNNVFNINEKKALLEDVKKQRYKVEYLNNFTHIYNHEPINLISKLNKLNGFGTLRIELLDESAAKTQSIINSIKDMI